MLSSYKRLYSSLRARIWFITLISLLLLFPLPQAVKAHPLDEFYQVTFITVAPGHVNMIVELYTGILIAPQIMALIDSNQDDIISENEGQYYVDRFLEDISFEIDGVATRLTASNIELPSSLDLQAGVGVIRFYLRADFPPNPRGDHQLFYQNNHQPVRSVYVVNALSDEPAWVRIQQQDRDIHQTSLRLNYSIHPDTPLDSQTETRPVDIDVPGRVSAGQERLTSYLYEAELSPIFMLVALGLSIVLGGLHALTPGHGKSLVAAYLIGSRGTIKHAVFLGGVVTFTHTASVIAIGLLALLASQFIVPNVLVPVLEILSGILVIYLGGQLLWGRWQVYKHGDHAVPHIHNHSHNDQHHPAPDHEHHHPIPEDVKLSDLLTLGISGGLVPCPEALGVMLIAIGLNRILLGLGLVVAFSIGLAAVLIVIGILLVRTKSLVDRVGRIGSRWQTLLPVISATIVTLLGVGIVMKGLLPYLNG